MHELYMKFQIVSYKIITATNIKMAIFWNVLVDIHGRFGGHYCLCHQHYKIFGLMIIYADTTEILYHILKTGYILMLQSLQYALKNR